MILLRLAILAVIPCLDITELLCGAIVHTTTPPHPLYLQTIIKIHRTLESEEKKHKMNLIQTLGPADTKRLGELR